MTNAIPVQFEDITFSYGEQPAIQRVSLDICPGELVVLVGPSGCGKSTLLKLAAGLLTPDRGRLLINQRETLNIPPEKRKIGWVPQSYALFEHLNVSQNIEFGLKMHGVPRRERSPRIQHMLDLCRIPELAQKPVADLSGGQRQRVAIARALTIQPQVMLLDEPLAALDPQLRLQLRADLEGILRETGITTIFVTHDQEEALALADRVAVLKAGRLIQFDTPETLWHRPRTAFVASFIGNASVLQSRCIDNDTVEIVPGMTLPWSGGGAAPRVALRAADLILTANGQGADLTVQSVEFAGDHYRITGETDQQQQLRVLSELRVSPGERIRVTLQPGRTPVIIEQADE